LSCKLNLEPSGWSATDTSVLSLIKFELAGAACSLNWSTN